MATVSKSAARRYLLSRLGFAAESPWRDELRGLDGTLTALKRLENIQIDPVNVIGRNQSLAVAQRVRAPGAGLDALLADRKVFEYTCGARFAYPIEDYPYFRFRMRQMAGYWQERLKTVQSAAEWVLRRLATDGPLPSRALETEEKVQGFWDSEAATKATRHALDLLEEAGLVMTVRREGTERHFGLPEDAVPQSLLAQAECASLADWRDFIVTKYFRGHILAHASDFRFGWVRIPAPEKQRLLADWCASGKLVAFRVDGIKRVYYALAEHAAGLMATPATAAAGETDGPVFIIPPLDNLLFQRDRLADLFDFRYTWEIYVPDSKRRYGPYTMPLLAGERLIGRLDARHDRPGAALVVNILELEPWVRPGKRLQRAIRAAVEQLARSVGATVVSVPDRQRVAIEVE
ncbi:MAG: DNA glycosylase AlkZ-like family protein [Chloroflexota bacterium]